MAWLVLIVLSISLGFFPAEAQTNLPPQSTNDISYVIEAAGTVEFSAGGNGNWQPAVVGTPLHVSDRLRTQPQSRAAVQLSDRSILRLSERTTLQLLPPRRSEKRRFGLPQGSLFFFNREKPADIEFDTPLGAGAIRGTEFLLAVNEADAAQTLGLRLALLDGLVTLQTSSGDVSLQRGQDLRLRAGQPLQVTPLLNPVHAIQWALYYPAVVSPEDLAFSAEEQIRFMPALKLYQAGDILAALAALPPADPAGSIGARAFGAALALAVGQVDAAEATLQDENDSRAAAALRELIATVRGEKISTNAPRTASEWLARSYTEQARAALPETLAAAQRAAQLAPKFGMAHARVAELEFAFGHRRPALAALEQALALSPRLASAHVVRGFVQLESGETTEALAAFDHARALDAGYGPAWLGRGLCLLRQRRWAEARAAFQAAAALEPQRGLFRAYLGKAASELGDARAAEKEFGLAHRLDLDDPTGWLYSALHLWQQNRFSEAIRDLERSIDLNDQRAPFRSRLLLDQDRSVRSANLAAIYDDAGLGDVSQHIASRAVGEDYANFSGHLFLANSYQALEDHNRFDLRLETARESELLLANLLAPPGAGNLSQQLSQQEHLRFFEPRQFGLSSLSEYQSTGIWRETVSLFGTVGGLSYAADGFYETNRVKRPNEQAERGQFTFSMKQRVSMEDELYFQVGYLRTDAGDVAHYYDPAQAKLDYSVRERQEPALYAGWHHVWSPGSHTLALVARLEDQLDVHDGAPNVLFIQRDASGIAAVETPPFFNVDSRSDFTLYSGELQQIFESPKQSLVLGGRWQSGDIRSRSLLSRIGTGAITNQDIEHSLRRGNAYAYYSWNPWEQLRVMGGVSYDHLTFPANSELAPLSEREDSRDQVSPKIGLLFNPWTRGLFRASYTRSLGGVFFDPSVRLEPTQVGGFNQAFRSLIPESVSGLVPGTRFDTAGVGFDQSLRTGTWFGVEVQWLHSDGDRTLGALTNSGFLAIPDSASSTRQILNFRERSLSAYGAQLLGDWFSVSARYNLSEARLRSRLPQIPAGTPGLEIVDQNQESILHQISLGVHFYHPSGIFAEWNSSWYHQSNRGYSPDRPAEDFWQHDVLVGYRFPRRQAELRVGLLNLFDQDYRLSPLNFDRNLSRRRTVTVSARLNF